MRGIARAAWVSAFAGAALSCSSTSPPSAAAAADAGLDASTGGTVCLVADTGGLDDRSFNQTAFDGVKQAKALYGWEEIASESQTSYDYAPNIQKFVASGKCNLIVTVGFTLTDATATATAADATPAQRFQLLDATVDPDRANVWGAALCDRSGVVPRRIRRGGHQQERHRAPSPSAASTR